MKKLILLIMIMLCISCSSRKVYATEKATIYNKNDFYISYNKNNDYYICEFKNEDKIYYIKSDDVDIKVLPYEKFSEYELYVNNKNVAYKLIIYIGVDD